MANKRDAFTIVTQDGSAFEAIPEIFPPTGKVTYLVKIEGQVVRFGGNPDIGGMLIIPYAPPAELDLYLLEDIAKAIEQATF